MPGMALPLPSSVQNGNVHTGNKEKRPRPQDRNYADSATKRKKILEQKRCLPIASAKLKLLNEIRDTDILIIVGETGSGKTTQLPQFLYEAGFCEPDKIIGITQPRRVAAVTVATRVAEEMDVPLGKAVGYSIRFEDSTSSSTRIKYMTDGMLVREAILDPLLQKYSVIIVDEAHERTIQTDVLLGLLKDIQARRREMPNHVNCVGRTHVDTQPQNHEVTISNKTSSLKLLVMSATLDAQGFINFFNGAKVVYIQGRQFPVEVFYTYKPEQEILDAALSTILQIHLEEGPGDILVFLTGQEEIESMTCLLRERIPYIQGAVKVLVVPIYAALPNEQQMQAFRPTPSGTRKVILATNIAETSVTIPGIRYVVDPGLVKARSYNSGTGVESLDIAAISKAQAVQRSGRAGRECAGKCFRLYTEDEFYGLADSTVPEITRCNLANVILQLKALGIDDVLGFNFLNKPSRRATLKALEHLYSLGALTEEAKLSTPVGVQMANLPLEPILAKALLVAVDFGCTDEMLATVAMLSVESIFFAPHDKLKEAGAAKQRFVSLEGDHLTFVNILHACLKEIGNTESSSNHKNQKELQLWCKRNFINGRSLSRALDVYRQIKGFIQRSGLQVISCGDDLTTFRRCLTAAFFLNSASRQPDGTYRALASGQIASIHPSSSLHGKKPEYVVFNELVRTTKQYIRTLTVIDALWLPELAPQLYAQNNKNPDKGFHQKFVHELSGN